MFCCIILSDVALFSIMFVVPFDVLVLLVVDSYVAIQNHHKIAILLDHILISHIYKVM